VNPVSRFAWGILGRFDHGRHFLGVYNWCSNLPVCADGMRISLFRTRKQAKEAVKELGLKRGYGVVVRVRVLIQKVS
jgi:hypothetical protein